jgi:hypothetical protein
MIVGIAGKMQVGKDTAAEALISSGYTRIAFADFLKEFVMKLFDMSWNQMYTFEGKQTKDFRYNLTPRELLQWFGTDVVRANFPDLWVQHMKSAVFEKGDVVIPDVRFANEAKFILDRGGMVIEILRPSLYPSGFFRGLLRSIKKDFAHISERPINKKLITHTLINDGTVNQLKRSLLKIVESAELSRRNYAPL